MARLSTPRTATAKQSVPASSKSPSKKASVPILKPKELSFDTLLNSEDLRVAADLASDIVINGPKTKRLASFSEQEFLTRWTSEKSKRIAQTIASGLISQSELSTTIEEILEVTLLEGFLLSYLLATRISQASQEGFPLSIEGPIKIELWERGLLSDEEYKFESNGDPYLEKILFNRSSVMQMQNRMKAMIENGEGSNSS